MTHAHSLPPPAPDKIWLSLRSEAETLQAADPILTGLLQKVILQEKTFSQALARLISDKLATVDMGAAALYDLCLTAHQAVPSMVTDACHDMIAIRNNDPAAHDMVTPFLFFKGFHAIQAHRVSHWLWGQGRRHLALYLQNRISDLFGVDIHPAAQIGHGVMMDHATGIVIGETAVVEDDVLFWHGVTLGGKGTFGGDRHPKIRRGVLLGAGSTILGNVEIGAGTRVAASSVVLTTVPAGVTVAGIPAQIVKKAKN